MIPRGLATEVGDIAYRTTPGAAGTAITTLAAVDNQVFVSLLVGGATFLFVVLQIVYFIWKWRRNAKLPGMVP